MGHSLVWRRVRAVAVTMLCLGGCRSAWTAQPRVVEIGFAQQGYAYVFGAAQLAIDALNRETATSNLTFRLRRAAGGEIDPVRAAANLRDMPAVVGVVGAIWSQDMLDSVIEYEAPDRPQPPVVAIAPVSTNGDLSGISPWVFRLCPTDSQEALSVARFAIDSMHVSRAALLFANEAFGRDWSATFQSEFERLGGKVVLRRPVRNVPEDLAVYAAYIERLKPDVIALPAATFESMGALSGLVGRIPLVAGDGSDVLLTWKKHVERAYFAEFFTQDAPGAEAQAFVHASILRNPAEPVRHIQALTYDAVMLLGRAAMAVGPDRNRVRDYLSALGNTRPPLRGVTGQLAFDDLHNPRYATVRLVRVGQ